jgi:hypothetical protein
VYFDEFSFSLPLPFCFIKGLVGGGHIEIEYMCFKTPRWITDELKEEQPPMAHRVWVWSQVWSAGKAGTPPWDSVLQGSYAAPQLKSLAVLANQLIPFSLSCFLLKLPRGVLSQATNSPGSEWCHVPSAVSK